MNYLPVCNVNERVCKIAVLATSLATFVAVAETSLLLDTSCCNWFPFAQNYENMRETKKLKSFCRKTSQKDSEAIPFSSDKKNTKKNYIESMRESFFCLYL